MHPWIVHVKDVQADDNYGYRAVASLLSFGEAGWPQVRCDLLGELNALKVVSTCRRLDTLSHFDGASSYDKRMIIPEMRFLMSSHYKVVLLWYYSFYHSFRVWLSCHLELHLYLLLHADPFQLVLSILTISLSYIYTMDIQYSHWHISDTSINYQVLKVGTVHTWVDCICTMSCLVDIVILNVQSLLIKHWLKLIYDCDFWMCLLLLIIYELL